ncbi:MAG: hypothetical protein EXS01_04555, partial [Phycisphaerales bacterium]|nr:hypothetical protein [Phycisphaerales bacterium]
MASDCATRSCTANQLIGARVAPSKARSVTGSGALAICCAGESLPVAHPQAIEQQSKPRSPRNGATKVECRCIRATLIEMPALLSISAIVSIALAQVPPANDRVSYAGESVVRVKLDSIRDLRLMEALSVDMWSHGIYNGEAEFQVTAEQRRSIDSTDLAYCVMIDDLEAAIEAERKRIEAPPPEGGIADLAWFAQVKDLAAINARLDALVAARPDLASIVVAGQSLEGRPIRGLRISALAVGTPAPAVLFDAT